MKRTIFFTALTAVLVAPLGVAQSSKITSGSVPGIAGETPRTVGGDTEQAISQVNMFGNFDALKARISKWNAHGKSLAELLAEDRAAAIALTNTAKLPCNVANALLVAMDDKAHTKTFEVACDSGAGYFLVQADPPGNPSGFTCFAADAARQADIAAHREPAIACSLPENSSTATITASILTRVAKVCTIRETKWRGLSATTDYLELSCREGPGYLVQSPLPGSSMPLRVQSCAEAAASGVPCRLAGNDTTRLTFQAVLAQYKVACDAQSVRVIGHETLKRRQVVEFLCPQQQPKGLVAFVPAEGSSEPFEVFDCPAAAAKRQAFCTLTKPN
jgi:hypothetical protein